MSAPHDASVRAMTRPSWPVAPVSSAVFPERSICNMTTAYQQTAERALGGVNRRPSYAFLLAVVGPVHVGLVLANQTTGSSCRRPTLSLKQFRLARGEITKIRFYIHPDELPTTRNPISTGRGADLRAQKSFIQRLRCRFACALSVRMRLRSRSTDARRHLQRHESQNACVETRRLGLAVEFLVRRSRAQGVATGFCVRRYRSRWM